MSSEKQNNIPAWNDKFLQWEKAGGKTEDRQEVLWEKLQQRLRPAKKRTGVYLFRAAIVLALVVLVFFLAQEKHSSVALSGNIKNPVSPAAIVQQAIIIKGNISQPVTTSKAEHIILIKNKKHPVEPVITPVNIINEPILAVTQPIPVTDTVSHTVVPAKPKLRIVHMNEWNGPPPPTYASVKETWRQQQTEPEEPIVSTPSIWPGKNKSRPIFSMGN